MARVDDRILNSAVFLYRDADEALTGSRAGGTGFNLCVEYEQDPDTLLIYIVTARHCIEGGFTTVRANALGGGFAIAEIPEAQWHFHNDGTDVAVTSCWRFDKDPDLTHLPARIGVQRGHDLGIGDAVFMVGRLLMHDGSEMNIPSLRFGNISMIPSEPIPPTKDLHASQETIVLEMRSIGGYSGSPVFVYDDEAKGDPFQSSRLLGLDYCHFHSATGIHSGAAGVIPAWKISELLYDDERLIAERRTRWAMSWSMPDA